MGELVLKGRNLFEELLFNVLWHRWSVAGERVAHSAGDKRTQLSIITGGKRDRDQGLVKHRFRVEPGLPVTKSKKKPNP
jgi:hypothetical protein